MSDSRSSLVLFSALWALAALFHVVGNPTLAPAWSLALLGVGTVAVLARPGRLAALVLLACAQLLTVWLEAPVLSNHWLLVGLVNIALLAAVGLAAVRRVEPFPLFAPAARLTLISFYAFAAFSKLNDDFFDRSVSCAVFFFHESTRSLGLEALQLGGAAGREWLVIVGTVAIESSIPVLLLIRRTRHVGVLLGLGFHFVLALDRTHEFFDFSSVLFALFLLFLPASFAGFVLDKGRSIIGAARRAWLLGLLHAAVCLAVAGLFAIAAGRRSPTARDVLLQTGLALWIVFGLATIFAVVVYLRTTRAPPSRAQLRLPAAALAAVPALAVLNGLTPYLELKTGYGWNMYSNLRTVAGETNHLIVPATAHLTEAQDDAVRVVTSSDPALRSLAEHDYGLAFRQLQAYLARHPDVSITFERAGRRRQVARAGDHPDLVRRPAVWLEKLFLLRAIDLQDRERCVPAFGGAR